MLKYLFPLMITFVTCEIVFSQDTLKTTVYFDVDEDVASTQELKKLDSSLTQKGSLGKIMLSGHTDSDGADKYNQDLAKRRVVYVKNYLDRKGLDSISTDYYGEQRPVASNSKEAQKWRNRRVEVLLVFKNDLTAQLEISLDNVFEALSAQEQVLELNNVRDTIFVLDKGTIFILDKGTFPKEVRNVTIKVKEVYSYADMIGEGLTTASNGRRLQTGGMLKVEAYDSSGNSIKPKKPFTVMMPTENSPTDMKLFFGERDPQEEMNWSLASDELHTGENSSDMLYIPGSDFISLDSDTLIPPIGEEKLSFGEWFSYFFEGLFSFQGQRKRSRPPRMIGEGPTTKELMDSLGVDNYEELKEVLTENRLKKGQATAQEIGYYGFRSTTLGWVNCDEFLEESNLITMLTEVSYERETMTRLVFKKQRCIFPANHRGMKYVFKNVPRGAEVYHVIIKTDGDKVLLSVVEMEVGSSTPAPDFKELSLSELKSRLAALVD